MKRAHVPRAAAPSDGCAADQRNGDDMSSLTVWKFETPFGADAAVVSGEAGRKKPKTEQMHDMKKGGALGGGFWGLLFGLIFFVPILGLAIGAATRAVLGSLGDVALRASFLTT